MSRFSSYIHDLVNMSDQIDIEMTSKSIRKHIYFRGPNVIILACAIVIASVGLNLNAIPVIIGAMLISPLMGPIVGFGFGMGTNDTELVKDALKNFAVMVAISILASTVFFLISPLRLGNQSELLARTNPTIYDVLIALFGGFAGILETTRKEKGTVISGVAIATALMPPLCTVGYGLSQLNWSYVLGALYLFTINSIFIALATFTAVKYLRFPKVSIDDPKRERRTTRSISLILLIVIVPSIISAIQMIGEENFNRNVDKLVSQNKTIGKSYIYDFKTDRSSKPAKIEIFMAGEVMDQQNREHICKQAEEYGITRSQIVFREEAATQNLKFNESEFVKDILEDTEQKVKTLNETVSALESELQAYKDKEIPAAVITKEICAQYPSVTAVVLSRGDMTAAGSDTCEETIVAIVHTQKALSTSDKEKMQNWLKVRLSCESLIVLNVTGN